jgi:hypothetical protein
LTAEEAIERFRARAIAELRILDEHLPRSRRLDRREIERLVDNLLFAHSETAKRRHASLFDKAVWMAGGVLVHALRRRARRRTAPGTAVHWYREARDADQRPQDGLSSSAGSSTRGALERIDDAASSAGEGRVSRRGA